RRESLRRRRPLRPPIAQDEALRAARQEVELPVTRHAAEQPADHGAIALRVGQLVQQRVVVPPRLAPTSAVRARCHQRSTPRRWNTRREELPLGRAHYLTLCECR